MSIIRQINALKPGESLVYYTSSNAPLCNAGSQETIDLRNEIYKMYQQDMVELTQELVGRIRSCQTIISIFDYIVTKKRFPPKQENIDKRTLYDRSLAAKDHVKIRGHTHGERVVDKRKNK